MITTTWTKAPADLLGLGSDAVRPYPGVVVCPTPVTVQGTGLPTGGADVRQRPVFEPATQAFAHNSIGTTLGIHSSRRPQS
ncbi:MAG TPA: hypothetical protein VK402_20930 [Blastococcus sp.]|nr:hypothetical protein [Blastococcus sp.]